MRVLPSESASCHPAGLTTPSTPTILNRQRRLQLDLAWLRRFAAAALPLCLARSGDGLFALRAVEEIAIAVVSDPAMAALHQKFMRIAGPTDVITFTHGDLVISADTARARAAEFGHTTEAELGLYIVHGLLHLNGFDDTSPRAAARMRRVQERIWPEVLHNLPPPEP